MPNQKAISTWGFWAIAAWCLLLGIPVARGIPADSRTTTNVLKEYKIRAWQSEHGLPNESVQTLLQTLDGYLWLGTRAGVARYDGIRFTAFNRANTPAMVNEIIQALTEDREDSLWVGTEDGLLCRRAGVWVRYTVQDGLPATNIWALCATQDGSVWAGTGLGLACFRSGRFVTPTSPDAPGRCKVMALHEDTDRNLWIGTSNGLFRLDPQSGKFDQDLQSPIAKERYVSGVFRDPAGRLWIATSPEEGYLCALHCWDAGKWTRAGGGVGFTAGLWPARLAAERDGAVWVPTPRVGLWREFQREFLMVPLLYVPVTQPALALSVDHEGNVWAGLWKGGLLCLEPRRLRILATDEGLPHAITRTVCEARDGSVWIGTDGGVSQLKEGRILTFTQTNGLSRNEVRSVVETRDGTVWVGTLNGLDSIRDGQVSHVRFPGDWFETKIRALLPARDGALWVGTVRGLTRWHNGQQTKYTRDDGLGAEEVRALLEDRSGNLWIGTLGGGLSCLREGKFTTLSTTNGLSNNNVWALHEDQDGVLWIGTERGLNRLKDGRLTVFTSREGLPDDLVNTLLEDDFGRLWVGHDRGIYWVTRQDLNDIAAGRARSVEAVRYDQTDGLLTSEVSGQVSFPAACKTRDGSLWIPTMKGVAVINPAKVAVDATPPVSVIEEIRAGGETVFWNGPTPPGATNSTSHFALRTSHLKLPPGHGRVLEFRYTASAFVAPEKVRFRYRMVGLERNWIDVGPRREVFFPDLRPGDYEFEVIAANHHGVWPDRGARVAVHLSPFVYQTRWFWPAVVLLAAAVIGAGVRWRLRELRRLHELAKQTALAAERERIARDMHDDLGTGLTRLVLLGNSAARRATQTEARTDLGRLTGEAAALVDQLGDLIWCAGHSSDTLDSLLARAREHAATFLGEAGVTARFDLPPDVPALQVTGNLRHQVLSLFKEILTNVVRHAHASEVHIRARLHQLGGAGSPRLELEIADNGCGFDAAPGAPVHGNGLLNLRARVAALEGSLELESAPGRGTTCRVKLPLAPHLAGSGTNPGEKRENRPGS